MNVKKLELKSEPDFKPQDLNETQQLSPGLVPTLSATPPTEPRPYGATVNYKLVKVHAHGGLGRVWSAVDLRLNREVAIKELLPKCVNDAGARRRFLLEAQVTGQLTHPHIVPIYQLGDHPETGAPYYAMRFIHGATLGAAVAAARKLPTGMPGIERRRLLSAFVSVCNAVAYAHARGVVHRDLKPENIVLGEYGEVLVIDWGLAKVAGHEDEAMAGVEVSSDLSSTETQQGAVLGTPVYMAPEQAAGKVHEIDARTDVFGLGAILFEILTGEPPHKGGLPVMELLYQISISPCRNPRAVDMRVPPALAAICAKATMLAPTDRYPSATDLAHDIDLWLAGEPVSAYREPWQAQAWRWARRHRTLVTTSAMLLLTSVLGLSLNAWMVGKEQERTKNALVRAQKNLNSARQAVDQMLTGVAAKDLENAPRMESLRRDLFKKALTFYQAFANDSPDDPELRIDVAEAYEKVGDIASLLGDPVPATNAYGRSIQLLESLQGIETLENATAYRLAHVHNSLGEVLRKAGDLTDAEREYRIAIKVLLTSDPGPTDMHGELARVDYNLGLLLFESNRTDEAEVLFNDSIASYNELLRRDPNHQEYQQGLARTFINLGMLKRNSKQTAQCEAAYGKAITILKTLLAKDPNAQEYRYELGTALLNLGNARLSDPARRAEAEQPYRDSLAQLGPLVTDFPATPLYLKELANATNGLGSLLYRSDKSDEAEKAWRTAIASFENLMEVQPDVPEHESLAALTKHNLAYLLFKKSKSAEACELLESAKTLQQLALGANPRHQQRQEFLRFHCRTLAEVYVQMNLHGEVREIANELAGLEGVSSKDVYRCARFMANTIALVRADESLSAEVRTAAGARNTREAISLLERAVAMGYSDRKEIETQADFEALRSDQDFQKLVEKLPISNQ